jgi:hypothetical protein
MALRALKWGLLLAAAASLACAIFYSATPWTLGAFFVCGGSWYWLTWRKTRELDAPRPKGSNFFGPGP